MTAVVRKIFPYLHEILLAVLLVTVLIVAAKVDDAGFVTPASQMELLVNAWDSLALLAIPMTLIIITGGIDLSVGSTMALASVTLGILHNLAGWPIGAAAAAAILVGSSCGFLNGIFVTKVRVHPLIVTLATFSAYRGLAEGLSLGLGAMLNKSSVYSGFPASFQSLGRSTCLGLSAVGWLFVAAAVAGAIVLAKTTFGRAVYAIGHNETAARFSGLKVDRTKLIIYTLSGLMAGLVAVDYSAYNNTAKADVGLGFELDVITAVVLGGISIFGGRGRMIGTVLGIALIHETREFVKWQYNQAELVRMVLGVLLIVAVASNALIERRSARK